MITGDRHPRASSPFPSAPPALAGERAPPEGGVARQRRTAAHVFPPRKRHWRSAYGRRRRYRRCATAASAPLRAGGASSPSMRAVACADAPPGAAGVDEEMATQYAPLGSRSGYAGGGSRRASSSRRAREPAVLRDLDAAAERGRKLHMGHAMFVALEIVARFHRMRGHPTLWLPAPTTPASRRRCSSSASSSPKDVADGGGRDAFLERVGVEGRRAGRSRADPPPRRLVRLVAQKFTLEPSCRWCGLRQPPRRADLRGEYLVNWSPSSLLVSDLEVEYSRRRASSTTSSITSTTAAASRWRRRGRRRSSTPRCASTRRTSGTSTWWGRIHDADPRPEGAVIADDFVRWFWNGCAPRNLKQLGTESAQFGAIL